MNGKRLRENARAHSLVIAERTRFDGRDDGDDDDVSERAHLCLCERVCVLMYIPVLVCVAQGASARAF